MSKADRRTGRAAGVRPLDSDAVAELVAGVPTALLLTVGANSIRLAQADHADPAAAVANRNRVLTAFHCLARFLDEAGPDLADLDVAAGFSREAADAARRRIEADAAIGPVAGRAWLDQAHEPDGARVAALLHRDLGTQALLLRAFMEGPDDPT